MDRVTTADGIDIAVHHLPAREMRPEPDARPALVMVHATGLCGPVMEPLARALSASYRCLAPDQRGHGASGRPAGGDFDWSGFAADVAAVVDGLGLVRPFGIGHSCGGTALLLAEQARPGTFRALYCFEPVVFPVEPPAGVRPDNPLSLATLKRRRAFSSREEAYANFASKPPLSALDPLALRGYVDHGFHDLDGGGIELRCRREDEAAIYANGSAHHAFSRLDEVSCPVTLVRGTASEAMGGPAMGAVAAPLPHARTEELTGLTHFGLLEDTDRVAASVLAAFGAEGGPGGIPAPVTRQA
ncbi:MAG: alpha/beta fold hydrolase [Acidimicrobiales bacterium]